MGDHIGLGALPPLRSYAADFRCAIDVRDRPATGSDGLNIHLLA
jgi:hypothetical protein